MIPERPPHLESEGEARARRRLRAFGFHLIGYFAAMVVLALLNYLTSPETLWFLFPMVGWGAPLALHAAWAMGLMDGIFGGK